MSKNKLTLSARRLAYELGIAALEKVRISSDDVSFEQVIESKVQDFFSRQLGLNLDTKKVGLKNIDAVRAAIKDGIKDRLLEVYPNEFSDAFGKTVIEGIDWARVAADFNWDVVSTLGVDVSVYAPNGFTRDGYIKPYIEDGYSQKRHSNDPKATFTYTMWYEPQDIDGWPEYEVTTHEIVVVKKDNGYDATVIEEGSSNNWQAISDEGPLGAWSPDRDEAVKQAMHDFGEKYYGVSNYHNEEAPSKAPSLDEIDKQVAPAAEKLAAQTPDRSQAGMREQKEVL